jgi:hypothetical protein
MNQILTIDGQKYELVLTNSGGRLDDDGSITSKLLYGLRPISDKKVAEWRVLTSDGDILIDTGLVFPETYDKEQFNAIKEAVNQLMEYVFGEVDESYFSEVPIVVDARRSLDKENK